MVSIVTKGYEEDTIHAIFELECCSLNDSLLLAIFTAATLVLIHSLLLRGEGLKSISLRIKISTYTQYNS